MTTGSKRRLLVVAVLVVVVGAIVAVPLLRSSSAPPKLVRQSSSVRLLDPVPLFNHRTHRFASISPTCPECKPPLTYGGGLVMGRVTAGRIAITPIYWEDLGYGFNDQERSLFQQFLDDVAATSGSTNNVFGVATQYFDTRSGSVHRIVNQISVNPAIELNTSFTPSGSQQCSNVVEGYDRCVTDDAIGNTVSNYLLQNHYPMDASHLYPVFLPASVVSCAGPGNDAPIFDNPNVCSDWAYCGYHSGGVIDGQTLVYAVLPHPDLEGCADPWNGPQAPNGSASSDAEISILSHEIIESITDYNGGGWGDVHGNEIGDLCAMVFGTPLGSTGVQTFPPATGTAYNQVINGHDYYLQNEFSNADFAEGRGSVTTPTEVALDPTSNAKAVGCVPGLTTPVPAAFVSASVATFHAGAAGSFAVRASGYVGSTYSVSRGLPKGLTFTDHYTGTAAITGKVATGGSWTVTLTAANDAGPNATQVLQVEVLQHPAITSPAAASFPLGRSSSATVRTTGYPVPKLVLSGHLPAGLRFIDLHHGVGKIGGRATARGTTAVFVTATSRAGATRQRLVITVR